MRRGFTSKSHLLAVIILVGIVAISVAFLTLAILEPSVPEPTPVGMISTTLNQDGLSGRNFFRAAWSLDDKIYEEVEALRELAANIGADIESNVDTDVRIWESKYDHRLILETTVDFRDPSEIEGILAIVYGRGYGRPEVRIDVREPQSTEFKTTWFIEMTVNPDLIPCAEYFVWKVNMPGEITSVDVTPSEASVSQSRSGSRTIVLTFEPEDRFVTVFVEAEESEFGKRVIWPLIVGVVIGLLIVIALSIWGKSRRIIVRIALGIWRRSWAIIRRS